MSARQERFPLFDSLRALAALSILALHGLGQAGVLRETLGGLPHLVAANLYIGVPVFFLISGFLLYRPFGHAHIEATPNPRVDYYAWRRVLRIVPAYWVALTATALVFGLGYVFTASHGPVFYGFGQIYTSHTTVMGLGPAWTLCVEMTFYAFLPAFAFAMRSVPAASRRARVGLEVAGLSVLFALGVAWTVWATARSDINAPAGGPLLNALPAYFDQFALGMGLAVLSVWLKGRQAAPGVIRLVERRPGVAWIAALALWLASIAVASDPGYEPMSRAAYLGKHLLFGAVAVGVLLPAIVGSPDVGAVRRLLASRTLLWLGLVSYGIYLYHQPVYHLLRDGGIEDLLTGAPLVALALQVCAALAVTIVLAGLSYYIVERPALGLRRLVERRPEQAQDQPGAVSVPAEAPVLRGLGPKTEPDGLPLD